MLNLVKMLIADGKLPEAINALRTLSEDPQHANELIGYMARYNDLNKHIRADSLSYSEITRDKNKLTQSLLSLINEVEGKNDTLTQRITIPFLLPKYRLWIIFLSFNIIILLGMWMILRSIVGVSPPINSQEDVHNAVGEAFVKGLEWAIQMNNTELSKLKTELENCKKESRNCIPIEKIIAVRESKRVQMTRQQDSLRNIDSYQEEEKIKLLNQSHQQLIDVDLGNKQEVEFIKNEMLKLKISHSYLQFKFDSLSDQTISYKDSLIQRIKNLETTEKLLDSANKDYMRQRNSLNDTLKRALE